MSYNIFKRPMFRKGGKAGLESLTPRQQYETGDSVQRIEDLISQRRDILEQSIKPSTGELALMVAQAIGQKPGGTIGEISGALAPQIISKLQQQKKAKTALASQDISDLISLEKVKAYKDRYGRTAGGVTGFKLQQLKPLIAKIQKQGGFGPGDKIDLKIITGSSIPSDYQIRNDYIQSRKDDYDWKDMSKQQREAEIQDYIKRVNESLLKNILDTTIAQGQSSKTTDTKDSDESSNDINKKIEENFADGGRAGYAQGDMVKGPSTTAQEPMNMDQGKQDSRFKMLRDRLPAEITDDIVQLIAYNEKAFGDFASIQSQSDVDDFNNRYGVSLAIPMNT